jgi:hypothetical protein
LTLDAATFFAAGLAAILRATGFGAAFLALTAAFGFEAVFFAERGLTALRAVGLAVAALLAFGFEADFALTARFAVFAVGFAFERDADRLKPFVRLLLMCGNLKRLLTWREQPLQRARAYHRRASKSTSTTICGCFTVPELDQISTNVQTKKNTCCTLLAMLKFVLAYGGFIHLGRGPQPNRKPH